LKKKLVAVGTGPSEACLNKPVEERFQELKNEANDLKTIIIRLDNEEYNQREIAHVVKKNPKQIKAIVNGDDPKIEEETANPLSRKKTNGKNAERNLSDSSSKDDITDDDAKLLKDILEQTSGINSEKTEKVVRFYQARKAKFTENPMLIYNLLTGAGLSPYRAQGVLTNFLQYTSNGEYEMMAPMMMTGGMISPTSMIPMVLNRKTGKYEHTEEDEDPEMKKLAREDKKFAVQMMREDMEDRRAERKQQKMMNQIMTMMMMKMMGEQQRGTQGAFGAFGSSPMSAFMFPEIEYAVQDGKILTDDYGNPVPSRMRYVPMTSYMMGPNHNQSTQSTSVPSAGYDKMFDVMGDALKSEREAKNDLVKTLAESTTKLSEQQTDFLKTRLDSLEQSDPIETFVQLTSRLKELGFVEGGPKTENVEVKRLQIDLEKWKHENNTKLQQWIWEQKQQMKDKEYARAQLKELGGSIRTGIEKLGVPLANGFADGLREGRMRSTPRQQNQTANTPPQEQVAVAESKGGLATQPEQTDVGKLNDDELVNTLGEAQKAEKVVENAKKQLVQEANRRGLKI
jgi:hypothetical protein